MPFHLRPYQSSDFEKLYALDRECYPRGIAYSRMTLRWFLSLPTSDCIVAETDTPGGESDAQGDGSSTSIAGFIVGESERKAGHIITLDVAPAWRREGIGSALLGELERRLAARGVRRIELETATDNQVAIAFWQRHGYRAVGVIERYYLNRIDALAMTKSLPEPT